MIDEENNKVLFMLKLIKDRKSFLNDVDIDSKELDKRETKSRYVPRKYRETVIEHYKK